MIEGRPDPSELLPVIEVDIEKLSRSERVAFYYIVKDKPHFMVECHGLLPDQVKDATYTGMKKLIERGWFERVGVNPRTGDEQFRGVPGMRFRIIHRLVPVERV